MYLLNGNEENNESVTQKLGECWVKLRDFGWVFFRRAAQRSFLVSNDRRSIELPVEMFHIEATFPQVNRMVNSQQGTGMLRRIPQRQWSLGLRSGLVGLFQPNNRNIMLELTWRDIPNIVNPTYPDFKNAVRIAKKSGNTLAFNELYSIKYDPDKSNFRLCRGTTDLGTITEDQEITLTESTKLFIPEIMEEIPNVILTP